MSRSLLRPSKARRKLVKRKYSKISHAEVEPACPAHDTHQTARPDGHVQEWSRPGSPSLSSAPDAKLLPKVEIDSLQTRLKESVKDWIVEVKSRVRYEIAMYRLNKVLGPEFDY
ncbi:hypothetical protein AYL99_00418 [Fonsecaea erecta]|uniref:Uncharacterized protein n=1 Tax=Fonsecaea erecta TaxID=1367422 RepID=A0A178ZYC8_9EURO|nr:hypothetical protein AYL99_00418 [Fonsecaea erecta]OAP64446.1 hypothetical protein AYL99_00418 [Fonsecaea erecta]